VFSESFIVTTGGPYWDGRSFQIVLNVTTVKACVNVNLFGELQNKSCVHSAILGFGCIIHLTRKTSRASLMN